MTHWFSIFALLLTTSTFAQTPIQVKVSGEIFNIESDSVFISHFMTDHYVDYIGAPLTKGGKFEIKGTLPSKDFYVLRIAKNQHVNLIIRANSDIKVYGDGKNISAFSNIVNSDESVQLNQFILSNESYKRKLDSANNYLRQFPDQQAAVNQSFQPVYSEFMSYRQQFIQNNANSPALIATLTSIDPEKEFEIYENVILQLNSAFGGSPVVEQVKNSYLQVKAKKDEMNFLAPGKTVPDFTQNKADGTPLSLSSLRGKVVLIDFWASWCRPCRAENPNVVKLYEKYQKDGFTVMSVSLDKDKAPWLGAIEKDQLTWPNHVSDLKGWSNEVSQMYKVKSIPFTVLIDQEGRVINTNLRGAELENTLKSIFGH